MSVDAGRRGAIARLAMCAGLAAAAITLAGCSSRGGPVPYGVKNFGAPDVPTAADLNQDYHVGARDVLSINVYRVPTLSGDMPVEANGNIVMPLLGPVPVMGKTTLEVAADLRQRLGEKYLQSPEVQVSVKASPRLRITVDGAVNGGGVFAIDGPTTLMQAVAMARGVSESSNPRRVVVFRMIDGQRMAAAFDLTDIRRGVNPDPVIYGDDIIIVDGNAWRSRFRDALSSLPLLAIFRPF